MLMLWRDYLELCKPRVVALMILTAIVGMFLAVPGMVPMRLLFFATMGIALTASSAAVINHLVDRHLDAVMRRTEKRPIVRGQVKPKQAILFALLLAVTGVAILCIYINALTAVLSVLTFIVYAFIYTLYLKHATPQNIVIGGIAGAAPPLLGWTAVTGSVDPNSLLLVLIIFTWTPPHFWALSIYRHKDYQSANVPMLPVTHGVQFTTLNIILYTILLLLSSVLPFVTGMSGLIYLVTALVMGGRFLYWGIRLYMTQDHRYAVKAFRFSIIYLAVIFIALLIDHYWFF